MGRKKKEDSKGRQPQPAADPLEARQASAKLTATAGALAGVVARFVVGPLDVLKIRFQVQLEPIAAGAMPAHYTSLRQALVTIVKEEGVKVRGTVVPRAQFVKQQWRDSCCGGGGACGGSSAGRARGQPPGGLLADAVPLSPPPLCLAAPCRACGAAPCRASC